MCSIRQGITPLRTFPLRGAGCRVPAGYIHTYIRGSLEVVARERSNVFYPVSTVRERERMRPRWAFGIDPRLHSRDVTRREDRRREEEAGKGGEGDGIAGTLRASRQCTPLTL